MSFRDSSSSGRRTFSRAVRFERSWKDWNTKPIFSRRRTARRSSERSWIAVPSTSTSPLVGRSSPAISARSVDLPLPEGPRTATISPRSIVRSTRSRIVSILAPDGSFLVTERSSMLAVDSMSRMYRKAMVLATVVALAVLSSPGTAAPAQKVVVFLGDSLTAGYGLPADQAFPSLLERKLREGGTPVRVLNAGVSGDTSAGALRRLPWVLRQRPDVVVVELGANDALRGQPTSGIEANLRSILEQCRDAGAKVLLVGMQIPTSYGPEYGGEFAALY